MEVKLHMWIIIIQSSFILTLLWSKHIYVLFRLCISWRWIEGIKIKLFGKIKWFV